MAVKSERLAVFNITTATSSVTFSSLNGNTDEIYEIRARIVNNFAGGTNTYILPNNDTGTSYGYQYVYGTNTTTSAGRSTAASGIYLAQNAATNDLSQGSGFLYAKSGYVRTHINNHSLGAATTTITGLMMFGNCWNNTADNITSLVIVSNQASGLGVGSVIELYRKVTV